MKKRHQAGYEAGTLRKKSRIGALADFLLIFVKKIPLLSGRQNRECDFSDELLITLYRKNREFDFGDRILDFGELSIERSILAIALARDSILAIALARDSILAIALARDSILAVV